MKTVVHCHKMLVFDCVTDLHLNICRIHIIGAIGRNCQ